MDGVQEKERFTLNLIVMLLLFASQPLIDGAAGLYQIFFSSDAHP